MAVTGVLIWFCQQKFWEVRSGEIESRDYSKRIRSLFKDWHRTELHMWIKQPSSTMNLSNLLTRLVLYKGKTKSQATTRVNFGPELVEWIVIFARSGPQNRKNANAEEGKRRWIILFRCGRWSTLGEAHKIRSLAKSRWGDTAYLLGGWSGERKDGALHNWKRSLKVVNATIKFVEATERLNNNRWRQREEDEEESNRGDKRRKECEES